MSIAYYVMRAIQTASGEDLAEESRSRFGDVLEAVIHESSHWLAGAQNLFDPNRWDLKRLLEHGRLRKPRIRLYASETSKGNFVIEWYPDDRNGGSDFTRFSNRREGYGEPDNRLTMIHHFEWLRHAKYLRRNARRVELDYYPEHIAWLIMAVQGHIQEVHDCLRSHFDAALVTDLELKWSDGREFNHPSKTARLIGVAFQDLEEKREQAERDRKAAWLKTTFDELGCSPEDLLTSYREKNNYAAVARALSQSRPGMSPGKVRKIIDRLTSDYPEIVQRVPDPNKVVPMRFPNSTGKS